MGLIDLVGSYCGSWQPVIQYILMEWIDDFLLMIASNCLELRRVLIATFKAHLNTFGFTREEPKDHVGFDVNILKKDDSLDKGN